MMNLIKNFAKDEAGAVSIDWVVLTAAIVAMGVAAGSAVRTEVSTLSTGIATAAADNEQGTAFGGS